GPGFRRGVASACHVRPPVDARGAQLAATLTAAACRAGPKGLYPAPWSRSTPRRGRQHLCPGAGGPGEGKKQVPRDGRRPARGTRVRMRFRPRREREWSEGLTTPWSAGPGSVARRQLRQAANLLAAEEGLYEIYHSPGRGRCPVTQGFYGVQK